MQKNAAQSNGATATDAKKEFSILVVADNSEVERLMKVMLKTSGLRCQFALKGGIGLTMFEKSPADIVLISTELPNRNGFALCLKLREKSTVPILMVTPKREIEEELRSLKVGADAYLEEPFNSRILMAHIVAQLRRTYRYNGQRKNSLIEAKVENLEPTQAQIIPGWTTCESCSYMGPQIKFEKLTSDGDSRILCPHCGSEQHSGFEIGGSFT